MNFVLLIGLILIISALSCKITHKAGLPILVGFILVGMLIGEWYRFPSPELAEHVCNLALALIIFTGGFQTNFQKSKPVLPVSAMLATAGTVLTAALAAAFGYYVMHFELLEALLLGSVISATDAASIFSILSSKKLNFKNNLGSILQMESGSNDPFAYMLTVIFLAMSTSGSTNVWMLLACQIVFGTLIGAGGAKLGQYAINRLNLDIDDLYAVLLCGIVLTMYGTATLLHGNDFLAVYIGGIMLGNCNLKHKLFLSKLFSAVSILMEITLFIVLGILWSPASLLSVSESGLLLALFLFFVARPLVVLVFTKPFGYTLREIALISWAGFRGASSIVFATYLLTAELPYANYVFSVVFFICMLSVIFQGSLIVPLAKWLDLISPKET